MPIHVDIRLNSEIIRTLYIGRSTNSPKDILPDSINTYFAVLGSRPTSYEEWVKLGTEFTHRYGDPVEVCVQKALDAIIEKEQPSNKVSVDQVIQMLRNRICFDNLEGRGCDHQLCYGNLNLIADLEDGKTK